jgi:hypothetical protein
MVRIRKVKLVERRIFHKVWSEAQALNELTRLGLFDGSGRREAAEGRAIIPEFDVGF